MTSPTQILTAEQMRDAEQRMFEAGMEVFALMKVAAGGAAEWVRRIAAGRAVTVLCGPGNNGGDGYVIAHLLREAGNKVQVIAPLEPKTDAAKQARDQWGSEVLTSGGASEGEVFVDCLFGSGLSRPLSGEHLLLLRDLSRRHSLSLAIDLPSGIASDSGEVLNENLPTFDVTLALGAWKFAHFSLPARAQIRRMRCIPIGIDPVEGAAELIQRPQLSPPAPDTHKYRRGLAAIIGGAMPGAAILASHSAMRGGAGYVRLISKEGADAPADLVVDASAPEDALSDKRITATLIGPGLGRDNAAHARLRAALASNHPLVLDADALTLLKPDALREDHSILATPHDGELETLCRNFSVIADGRRARALALARTSGMVVMAKGPDTVIAAPDGRIAIAPPSPSWLSVAGSGDVLAGIAVSRMATGRDPFAAACEAVWLHGEAARLCGPAFTALELSHAVSSAIERCL